MQEFTAKAVEIMTTAGSKIVLAVIVFIIGRIVIGRVLSMVAKSKGMNKLDPSVRSFVNSFVKILLYVILIISIISVLGVPMASVIAVLASAGVAVGLALQGALSNLAGGIMLMIFRPFNVGDFIEAAGVSGVVKEITLFYTIVTTTDNKRVTIPNGSLMNANVSNYTAEDTRRVDLTFGCAKGENIENIQKIMIDTMRKNSMVLSDPAPFAQLSGGTSDSMEFTVRAWTETDNYWDVYFGLTQQITEALGQAGIKAPAIRVITEK